VLLLLEVHKQFSHSISYGSVHTANRMPLSPRCLVCRSQHLVSNRRHLVRFLACSFVNQTLTLTMTLTLLACSFVKQTRYIRGGSHQDQTVLVVQRPMLMWRCAMNFKTHCTYLSYLFALAIRSSYIRSSNTIISLILSHHVHPHTLPCLLFSHRFISLQIRDACISCI
jgi:hypothetical protein